MSNKQLLVEYLNTNGKDASWDELAKKFNFKNGERARGAWLEFRRKNSIITPIKQYPVTVKESYQPTSIGVLPGNLEFKDILPGVTETMIGEYAKRDEAKITSFQEDMKSGLAEMSVSSDQEIKCLEDLIQKTNIDLNKWSITKWIQNFWANKYQVKLWLEPRSNNVEGSFQDEFIKFLENYQPKRDVQVVSYDNIKNNLLRPDGLLLINKQDSHLNKYDVDGDNDIEERFAEFEKAVDNTVRKASTLYNLGAIGYVIGSDQFNSEWTSTTTKGTPQQNILDYQKSFQLICDHEVEVIEKLAANTEELHVVFLPGNHDEYVGWHMIKWLEAYFKESTNIIIDSDLEYTKYIQYGSNAIMLNHGDDAKPEKLASIFPIGAKEMWSSCENRYIFTGDKHHTLAKDLGGIEFYQIPQLSKAKSRWDKKKQHDARVEMVSFVIEQNNGMELIIKEMV